MASIMAPWALGSVSSTFGAQASLGKRAARFCPSSVHLRAGVPNLLGGNPRISPALPFQWRRFPVRPSFSPADGRERMPIFYRESPHNARQFSCGAWAAGTEVSQIIVNSGLDLGDIQSGFTSAFLLIFFSEIGDKTFFIAALLATRKSSVAVFSGTFGALIAMTLITVCLGRALHYIDGILPSFGDTKLPVDDIAAVVLLVYFGVSTLIDAASMDESGEEKQEAELAIADVGAGGAVAGTVAATFALVFVAEWGDKSFFSTIALAAASSPLGVVTGAVAGHGAATLLAVLGGSFLGNYVSERIIAYVGGVLFLVFAGATLIEILN